MKTPMMILTILSLLPSCPGTSSMVDKADARSGEFADIVAEFRAFGPHQSG